MRVSDEGNIETWAVRYNLTARCNVSTIDPPGTIYYKLL